MDLIIILCAKYLIYIVAIVALGYWLSLSNRLKIRVAVFGIVTSIIAYLLAKIGSSVFYDARPFVSDHVAALFTYTADNGFPSDHTLLATSLAITVLFCGSKKWGVVFLAAAVVIGSARVLARVHHPIDIAGGLVFALIGGVGAYYLTPLLLVFLSKSKYGRHLVSLSNDE